MRIRKAVITAAGKNQRTLPLQTLIDRDGAEKQVLRIILDEVLTANIEQVCIVISPGDEAAYLRAAGDRAGACHFVQQTEPLGYGHAIYCAKDFVKDDPFLHLVGDHLYIDAAGESCAQHLVRVAEKQECAVSAVQPFPESLLHNYGAVGGQRIPGTPDLYRIETVIEKPTPTEAEQKLNVAGMRVGHYLCFFGMHVLTPAVIEILEKELPAQKGLTLSTALARLALQEKYLALDSPGRRYDVGVRYGLLRAQVALALSGRDRAEVLTQILEALAIQNLDSRGGRAE
ncbi:MAG TPA: sugar phosphate nucleotidyltransferase [Bryobacteraceae bacterium]|nr:sugar phosphate nucleotidyltransferase [Bryobacteraceae bacterium]